VEDLARLSPLAFVTSVCSVGILSRYPTRSNAGNFDHSEIRRKRPRRLPPETLNAFSVPLLPNPEFCRIYPALSAARRRRGHSSAGNGGPAEIGDNCCPTLSRSRHAKELAARQNGTTVGAVAKSQKFL
jgi:hypothetical protein